MTGFALAVLMCSAEVLGMLSFSTFQALIPTFQAEWGISNTEAGWISGVYFAGYVAAVPFLVTLTDRIDPRRVMLVAMALGGLGSLGFALFTDGFWSAMLFRAVQGVGLAGTYMPGLKALSDHTEGPRQSRYVAFYTSSFGIGAALSFVAAGEITTLVSWHWAFGVSAIGSVLGFGLMLWGLPKGKPPVTDRATHMLDFRPVLRNRRAMAFVLGYAGHNWELFALRSWMVAFLVFSLARYPDQGIGINATTIAALATLLGVPASIFGNEIAVRIGRRRHIAIVTALAVTLSAVIGFSSGVSYYLVVLLCLLYGVLATGDSAALTAGTVAAAEPGQRGATLAMHAFLGFMGGIFGPLAVGVALDAAGPGTVNGWGIAFIAVGVGSAMALVAVLRRADP